MPLISKEWGYKIVVSYQVDSDYKFSQTLRNRYANNYDVILIEDIIDSTTMYNLYSQAAIVFSNRLHVLMFSMFCGGLPIPVINQIKEQKINGIFSDAGLEEVILNISQGEDIINKLPALLEKSESIKEKISLCFQEKQKLGEEMLQQIFN